MDNLLNPTYIAQFLNFIIFAALIVLFLLWVFRHMASEIVKIKDLFKD